MLQNELSKRRAAAIWLRRHISGDASSSKLGGLPCLPNEIEWPRQRRSGTPLHFLAQIDLSRLPKTPLDGASTSSTLPRSGVLFFFADMVEEMLWGENGGPLATTRVIFARCWGPERSPPGDIPEILHGYGMHAGGYETGIAVYPHAALEPHVIDTFSGIDPFHDLSDAYSTAAQAAMVKSIEWAIGPIPLIMAPSAGPANKADAAREYIKLQRFQSGVVRRELYCPLHQMLGMPKDIQGTAEAARAEGNILLLQIDSDTLVHEHFIFCDFGTAQFWIKPDELAEGRFDKAWGSTEGA